MRRVVVTGIGALTPIGNTSNEFWNNLLAGKSGAAPITYFNTEKFKTKFACEIKGYNPLNYFEKGEARKYDLFTQYALITVKEAIEQAKIDFDSLNKDRIGVIWGSGNGGILTTQEQIMEYAKGDGTPRFNPYFVPKILVDIASGVISIKYGLRGINYTTVSACASSTTSVIDAFNYIRWNKADMIITGGSDAPINESLIGGFGALKALSTQNENPESASRPFDNSRDGFVMGEGAGAIILEEYEHAVKRGATILCEVIGGGMCADAYHLTGSHPEGDGAYMGMKLTLEDAGISAADVDYINPHATSTPIGDQSELKAIQRLFGDASNASISASKSMTGHLLGAAGAIEAIICIQAVQHNMIPPTINTTAVEAGYENLNLVLNKAVAKEVNVAISNTFGFGGHIAALMVKKI
ncbi:beta-ketoacyl-ACP synthase II [Cytophaga hutchinsonii]|uniref:3-oxoacyl-[acyl-carrier-protein] synthase 2 n=1 Tax=Cytophaga hutchinsonii (strain ATCC 33406 / DSM 1761 / CIP 103989 / NBRC 15051 / NCIMB 9469 / D465) TaxID=269798 RepID=A0A6N4SRD3_CYTH3|nr:beta-ketoacyl-ACP synthase II [Cytophaga hutchinsonii]ABG58856.1 3-oxoacyl-[acyl-carrier-protein] synthase II [Cytophaga hutchinsonii ATCC 33406]SFX80723.1 3-oxoacyl-[acyl-carrier-protein] synthase II [Cytophaga hutchinsonii ATCC 33406]